MQQICCRNFWIESYAQLQKQPHNGTDFQLQKYFSTIYAACEYTLIVRCLCLCKQDNPVSLRRSLHRHVYLQGAYSSMQKRYNPFNGFNQFNSPIKVCHLIALKKWFILRGETITRMTATQRLTWRQSPYVKVWSHNLWQCRKWEPSWAITLLQARYAHISQESFTNRAFL